MNADYQLSLDKGDLIQTGGEGVARIQFADGTTYTVKGDTLVTVEDNVVQQDHASKVGVHISSGQVDLATGSWEIPGSKAEVSFENAVASVRANSRAAVRSDPTTNQQEITVDNGSAELNRGGEHLDIGQWERASFPDRRRDYEESGAGSAAIRRSRSIWQPSSSPIPSAIRFSSHGSR